MGMFDYVRCDYPLTPDFNDDVCQTKDIDGEIGGNMSTYYIDPSGVLWFADTYGMPENKGRMKPYYLTDYLRIMPRNFDGEWLDRPHARLHIVQGKVQSFTIQTTRQANARGKNYCFQH